ncbi:MAG: hypothetical protein RPU64_00190 [Candidatus Sedimenticola sp. (ex Thyasira tokunagai)]
MKKPVRIFTFTASLFSLVIMFAPVAHAYYGYCSEPSEPSCLGMLSFSRDEFSFNMCRSEVESYTDEVESYVRCLKSELEEKRSEFEQLQYEIEQEQSDQIDKVNNVVEKFNCYAQGNDLCL